MAKWWEDETPVTAASKKNVLRLYANAEKLQVSRPDWENDHGEMKPGKTVVLDLAALKGSPEGMEILASVANIVNGQEG